MFLVDVYKDYKDFSSKNSIVLRSFYILVLAYPLFTLSFRDWSSGIYSLLSLIAIGYLFKKNEFSYPREVKVYAWIVFLFFISILISSTLNDWTFNSYKRLGTEAKILVFVPLFLLLAKHIAIRKWFIYTIPFAGIILGTHGILDVLVFNDVYADSAYGKIITGDISGLLVGLSGVLLISCNDKILKRLAILAMLLAAITCILSTSRNGWLVLIMNLLFLIVLMYQKNKKMALMFLLIPLVSVMLASTIINPAKYLEKAVVEYNDYMNKDNRTIDLKFSSVGFRLEQWRMVLIAFKDKPVFGVGPGNSSLVMNDYVEKGIIDKSMYQSDAHKNMGHVHNQYFDTLLVQGIVGLILVLLIIFYPAWIFIKYYKDNEMYASLGLVLVMSYSIFSLSEIPFISDNFTSIFFMYMSIFFLNVLEKESLTKCISK